FGIRDADSASRIARHADAVVIGSKLIETMEQAVADVPPAQQTDAAIRAASLWLGGIRAAMDQVKRERAPA
ncbi:tryptophan synthase subunit alpha, partial [Bordetella hinzii]|nr:tryptophan synthase subunit alpha [Bordetella hinzii]